MQEFLDKSFHGNTVETWLIALGITVVIWLALFAVRKIAVSVVERLVQKTSIVWDDVLATIIPRTHGLFLLTMALFAGTRWLTLDALTEERIGKRQAGKSGRVHTWTE